MNYSLNHMQAIYFLILMVAGLMEFSPRFNTNNFIKKIGLLLIIIGALAHLAKKGQPLMEIGFAIYLLVEFVGACCYGTFERRQPKIDRRSSGIIIK